MAGSSDWMVSFRRWDRLTAASTANAVISPREAASGSTPRALPAVVFMGVDCTGGPGGSGGAGNQQSAIPCRSAAIWIDKRSRTTISAFRLRKDRHEFSTGVGGNTEGRLCHQRRRRPQELGHLGPVFRWLG